MEDHNYNTPNNEREARSLYINLLHHINAIWDERDTLRLANSKIILLFTFWLR
jgi:hypothetical protein